MINKRRKKKKEREREREREKLDTGNVTKVPRGLPFFHMFL